MCESLHGSINKLRASFHNPISLGKVDAVFRSAQHEFLAALSEKERSQFSGCASVQDLLSSLEKFDVISKAKRRGLPLLGRIKSLSNNLGPYFKVMEILCSSHPEWASIAYGAFRFILQVCEEVLQ